MYLINLMENRVSKLTDFFLKEKNVAVNSNIRLDIIAYTLNRIKPEYITSAKGVIHTLIKNESTQINADILSIIADAYKMFEERKDERKNSGVLPLIKESGYYIVYPSLVGNIIESDTFQKVKNAEVYVYGKGELLAGYGDNFPNPLKISETTPGKFVFCFLPKKSDTPTPQSINFEIVTMLPNGVKQKTNFINMVIPEYCKEGDMPMFKIEELKDIHILKQNIENINNL